MSNTCIVLNGGTDAEKTMLSWFENDNTMNLNLKPVLLTSLKIWRDYNELGEDDYPLSKEEFVEFCKRHCSAEADANSNTEFDISDEQWEDLNDVNNGNVDGLGTAVLENRLRMVASMFSEKVDEFQKNHNSYSRSRCITELGGVKKIVFGITSELASLSDEEIVKKFGAKFGNRNYSDLTEGEKKEVVRMKNSIKVLNEHRASITILSRKFINEYETDVQVDLYSADDNPDLDGENGTELKGKRYIDHRGLDIGETLTSRAKNILSKIYRTDSNGNILLDDLGFPIKVSSREALQTLVQFCYTSTQETFIQDLNELAKTYPWIDTLINEIKNSKTKIGAMFGASKKAKMLYAYITLDKGSYLERSLNTMAAHDAVLRQMSKNFGSNVLEPEMSLYTELNAWRDKGSAKDRVNAANDRFDALFGTSKKKWTIDTIAEDSEKLARAAQGFGLDISAADIRNAANIPINDKDKKFFFGKYKDRYEAIALCIEGIYGEISGHESIEKGLIANNKKIHDLMLAIGLSKINDVDSKGNDGGKIRQTYITPNLITELMNDINNARGEDLETYLQKLRDKYLKYEGFTLNGQPTGLLEYLFEHPGKANLVRLGDESSFNTKTYDEMKKQQVGSMQYTLWRGSKHNSPKFIVPVSADYTVCYTLQVPREALPSNEGESIVLERDEQGNPIKYNTDASIVRKVADEVLCEFNRIVAVNDRLAFDKTNPENGRARLLTYEKSGQKFHIFPEMNGSGIINQLMEEKDSVKRMELLREKVAELLYNNYLEDVKYYEEQGIFTSPEFRKKVKTDSSGKILPGDEGILDPNFEKDFENFSMQTFYMRQQISKLVFGDTAHFKNILDYEKRAMMQHSPATPIYFEKGEDTENVMYIKDIEEASVYAEGKKSHFREMLDALVRKKLIPARLVANYLDPYYKIKATDGQGFRTLPSWKKIQEGLGKWTDTQEQAYNKIMNTNEPILRSDIEALNLGVMKLRYAGYQDIAATNTGTEGVEQKSIKSPVFHKYSEQVLLPYHRMKGLVSEMGNTPIVGLSKFAYGMYEQSKANSTIKAPELFLFESGCKVGGHDILDPWHDENGNILTTSSQIRQRLVSYISKDGGRSYDYGNNIQTLDMHYLGEAATLDTKTEDTEIHITSQAEKIAWGNTSPEDMIKVSGVDTPMKAVDGRRLYDEVSAAIVADAWRELCDELGSYKKARRILMREIGKMSYVSEETKLALTKVKDLNGDAMPLFSPTIQHEAQNILLSIIRNRMQKHKAPGARFVQKTSLGWDRSSIEYEELPGLFDSDKLNVVFEGESDNKRIAYVEAYVPITDHRLRAYANKNGEITPEMLEELVANGTIPEEMLYAVGYRTPSDAEHSIIPIKIKGFLSSASGRTIILPREVMVMTGHDYDGDEMPVHFIHAKTILDDAKVREKFDAIRYDGIAMQSEFGASIRHMLEEGEADGAFELYKKSLALTSATANLYHFETEQYDYSKQPLQQSENVNEREHILDNERLRLLFGQVSSPSYTQRMVIPGGCEETKQAIKTIQLLRIVQNHPNEAIRTELKQKITEKLGIPYTNDIGTLFMHIRGLAKGSRPMSSSDIESLVNNYQSADSSFSARHTVESFGYMIEAANMIGIFAKYMSSFQMLQKANVTYKPYISNDTERRTVLFGKEFNNQRMFEITDMTGENMLSRVMSRLINAAVDNGKDPILGILNINPDIAPLMVTMCGLGMTEDQIDLVISQPVIVAALKKASVERISFSDAINDILQTMEDVVAQSHNDRIEGSFKISYDRAADELLGVGEEYYAREAVKNFDDMIAGPIPDFDGMEFQKKVLMQVRQILGASEDLESFINSILRPESGSGGTGSSIGNTQRLIIQAEDCRGKIQNGTFRIGGLENIAKNIDFRYLMPEQELMDQVDSSETPQYTLMRSLEVRATMWFLRRWFPQARQSWQNVAERIAKMYNVKRIPDRLLDTIYRDMILWKMLGHEAYVGKVEKEKSEEFKKLQNHILDEVPSTLQRLQKRINDNAKYRKEKQEAVAELAEAEAAGRYINPSRKQLLEQKAALKINESLTFLENNSFLRNLKVYHEKGSKLKPRIQFRSGGIDMSKLSDQVRRDWTSLFNDYYDEDVQQLAADLVDYSLFVNGFGFGTYEFGHLSSVQAMKIANNGRMINAMRGIADSDFSDDAEIENFVEQFVMNHWRDRNFLPRINATRLKGRLGEWFGLQNKFDADDTTAISEDSLVPGKFYLITKDKSVYLIKYLGKSESSPFAQYPVLGSTNKYSQYTVEYNPNVAAQDMQPYQLGDTSDFVDGPVDPYAESNYENAPDSQEVPDSVRDEMLQERQNKVKSSVLGTLMKNAPKEIAQKRVQANAKNEEAAEKESTSQIPNPIDDPSYMESLVDSQPVQNDEMSEADVLAIYNDQSKSNPSNNKSLLNSLGFHSITRITTDENGNRVENTEKVPATPEGIELARKRNAYVELNRILRDILEKAGVGVGKLSTEEIIAYAEERLAINGVTDFDTAKTLANGLIEIIRIREGEAGEQALPEEFAHLAIQMLGGENNPIVQRLFNALKSSEEALQEAFDGEFETYRELYENEGGNWQDRLVEEAAGKLLAKNLLNRQEIKTSKIKNLIQRIVDAFHELLRKIGIKSLQDAIITADNEAAYLAKNILNGRLLDELNLNNISSTAKFRSVAQDLTDAKGTLEKLIKIETKEADILKRKVGRDVDKLNKSVAYKQTETAINALSVELRNHKTEKAVVDYMDNSLKFLQNMESVVDTSVRKGESFNTICGHLNELRDILNKTTKSLQAIRDGLNSGEIKDDTGKIQESLDNLAGINQRFYDKYKRLSKEYLIKSLLAPVYGPNGLDITVGKNKGKHVSLEDMATVGEMYMGIQIDAMIHSLAHQRDYVLKAFDVMVRNAKYAARRRQNEYAERLVVAVNKLHNATGSLDQSFMYELDKDGHRTGYYISKKQAENLSTAQRDFFNEMIDIKRDIDNNLPKHRIRRKNIGTENEREGVICIRKSMVQRIKDTKGLKEKFLAGKNAIQNAWDGYADDEYKTEQVFMDFEENKVDFLPIKYINKGEKESYDDMTDDIASAMMAYAGMATEYNEMHKVINILENAKFAAMERDIVPKSGNRIPVETISDERYTFTQNYTIKQKNTVIQKCLADAISMHVYGHTHKKEYINIFGHQVPVGKITDFISTITSYSQMAINIPQRISNVTTGGAQILIQTAGKDYFSAKDVAWASAIYVKEGAQRLMETGADETHNKLSLFNHRFDVGQRYNTESLKKKYGKSRFSKIVGPNLLYGGLELGEDYLASTTGLAIARNTKLLQTDADGKTKEINLYDAFDVSYRDTNNNTGAYLKLKDGVTKLDGTAFTERDEDNFIKTCADVNFKLQGIYNADDKAAIQQYSLGSLIIMYRKWIAPSLKRRYGHAQYNALTGTEEQGYWSTTLQYVGNCISNWIKEGEALSVAIDVNWNNMTDYEKSNIWKAVTETGILTLILLALSAKETFPPDDDEDHGFYSWWNNAVYYQMLRLKNELASQAPTPMLINEASKILSSPMASIKILANALNGLKLLWPGSYIGENSIISDENRIKTGRFKGHTQAYKYFWSLPILSAKKSIDNLIEPDALINYYKN